MLSPRRRCWARALSFCQGDLVKKPADHEDLEYSYGYQIQKLNLSEHGFIHEHLTSPFYL
ncbi:hypothetical protein NC652_010593 [Populus alba x Populus x berolinensis]|nr:hypothetical protein NC652_010593 [Populus alba x Populus x berolinensis]